MMIDPDLVAMAIVAAVLILPGVGISAYHHMRAKRIAFSPSATTQVAAAPPAGEARQVKPESAQKGRRRGRRSATAARVGMVRRQGRL